MNTVSTVLVLGAGDTLLFLLERALPLRRLKERLLRRLSVNFAISAAAAALVQPAAIAGLAFTESTSFGLARVVGLRGPLEIVAAFLLLDLSFSYWHVANHRVGLLWRFHNVHHIDPDLDVSTSFRFHFVEVGLSAGFRAAQVRVFVTPRMHGIHHSDIRDEDLSNFGVVFPWWDRLHGTLCLNVPQSDVRIGIPGPRRPEARREHGGEAGTRYQLDA